MSRLINPYRFSNAMIDAVGASASVAYGLRKLRNAYSGSGVRVRRVSDNAEQDIGFSGEALDWASAISFMGGSSLTVKTWYDQSGNGKDATQATTANQPVLDTTNFEVDFDGTNDSLVTSSNVDLSGTNKASFYLISRSSNVAAQNTHFQHNAPGTGQTIGVYHETSAALKVRQQNNANDHIDTFAGFTNGGFYRMVSGTFNRDLAGVDRTKSRTNRVSNTDITDGSVGTGNFASATLGIGATPAGVLFLNGSIKELIIFPVALTDTQRDNGELNIQTFHFSGFDVDAKVYFDQTGLSDTTQKTITNQLFLDFKSYSLWNKIKAGYLFVGGTAALHKWNLKDPRDVDGAFRLTFTGTVTHDSNGITPNGTTGYADTKLNGSTESLNNDSHLSVYVRTNNAAADKTEISAYNGASAYWSIKCRDGGDVTFNGIYRFVTDGFISVASVTNSQGFYVLTRRSASDAESYKNGASTGTTTTTTQSIPSATVKLGVRGDAVASFSDRNIAFASIGTGLTDTEAANFYTAVEAFQDALGRGVV